MIDSGRTPNDRFCGEALAQTDLDLGEMPPANGFLTETQPALRELTCPFHTRACSNCLWVQIDRVVTPEVLFAQYGYFSSFSASWVAHARRFAAMACTRFGLGGSILIVEIASNGGCLLRRTVADGITALDVETARSVAAVAENHGVPTIADFSDRSLPDSHLAVFGPNRPAQTRPAYVLILPWNLREEITASAAHIRGWGGRFVVPVPTTEVLQ